jgi:hypothetical protein
MLMADEINWHAQAEMDPTPTSTTRCPRISRSWTSPAIVQARAPNRVHKDRFDEPDHAELMRRGEKAKEIWRLIVEGAEAAA